MPGSDGTGPMVYGPMTGGRRGRSAGEVGWAPPVGGFGRGACYGRGGGGGRGYRNQYYATGLTGWQRAAQAEAVPPQTAAVQPEAESLARVESALADVREWLERLEAAGQA